MIRVALIAHDDEKPTMVEFVQEQESLLGAFDLVATGTTGKRVMEVTDLDVERKRSGPLGGDTQIGAEVADGELAGVVFFRDPLSAQPHEPDITALSRLCDVHEVPIVTTRDAARYLVEGLADERIGRSA